MMKNISLWLIIFGLLPQIAGAQGKDTVSEKDTTRTPESSTITTSGNVNTGASSNTGVLSSDTSVSVFVLQAISGSEKEIELGRAAQKKAVNKEVKSLALKMIYDHAKANDELNKIAGKKKITFNPNQEKVSIGGLATKEGIEFDKAYVETVISDHGTFVSLFEKAAETIKDPEIKAFALKTLPVLKQHYKLAKTLSDKLNGKESESSLH